MTHLKGEIFLGLNKDQFLLDIQDSDNEYILTEQKTQYPEEFMNLYNYDIKPKETPSKFEKLKSTIIDKFSKKDEIESFDSFSLKQVYQDKNSDDLVKYIKSLLNKLFPKYPKDHNVPYGIFGRSSDNWNNPYSYSVGYRPTNEELESFDFQVEYQGINQCNNDMCIKISWDFEIEDESWYGNILTYSQFSKEILYAISETKFLYNSFTFYKDISYSEITECNHTEKLQLIDFHVVEDINKFKKELNSLIELKPDHGILLTLEEASSLLNYDGSGYLCKEIDGKIYQSFITPNMDYALPKIYKDNFTHIYWYNR